MKKIIFYFLILSSLASLNAQVNAYSFSQFSGTYNAITGGTVFGNATTDEQRFVDATIPLGGTILTGPGLPIGFNFTYNGNVFDVFAINANGWISLGQSSLAPNAVNMTSSSYISPISATSAAPLVLQNRICALSRNLAGQTGSEIRAQTIGASPNQTLVVQYTNYRRAAATGDNLNFQIQLTETSNKVSIVYGTLTTTITTNQTTQVGLRGTANTDFNNRIVNATNIWATSIAGTFNTSTAAFNSTLIPASGQTYEWSPPPPCSGTPPVAISAISSSTGCPSFVFTLSATGLSNNLGIVYQWQQSSTPTGPWTNIIGATSPNFTTSVTGTTYYQFVSTCTISTLSSTSSVVSYSVVNLGPCVCGTYGASSAQFTGDEEILNVTFGTLNNTSNCTVVAPGPNSVLSLYSNYTGFVAAPTVMQGQTVPFSINVGTCGGNFDSGVSIYIDYNQNGLFTDAGEQVFLSTASINGPYIATGNITIPLIANVGVTRMRVVNVETTVMSSILPTGTYGYGETEDYCIDIVAATLCSGTPNSGTATIVSPTICPNTTVVVNATGLTVATGLTYQWQQSATPTGPWTNIIGATAASYTASSATTLYYQMVTTCTVSSLSATTSVASYSVVNPGPCVCNNYGISAATQTFDEDIWNVTFGSLNNTSNCTVVAPGPGSTLNMYGNYAGFVAAPTVMQGQTVPFSVDINTCGTWWGMEFDIYIDYNQNGLFTDAGELAYSTTNAIQGPNTGNITIPLTANAGNTRMRIVAVEGTVPGPTGTYFAGETEDYCIDIVAATPCSGTPNSGTATISSPTTCPNNSVVVNGTGLTVATGLTYQWQESTSPTGPWSNIIGATATSYTATSATTMYYQLVTTCTISSLSATTSVVSYSVVNPGPCVCNNYGSSAATSTFDSEILGVTFGTLNNVSNCSVPAPGPGSALGLYGNYAGFLTAPLVMQGQSVPFSVDMNTCGGFYPNAVKIYIDYNQNGLFTDLGEEAYVSTSNTTPFLISGNITIPLTASVGVTRMRVVQVETSTPSSILPTGGYTWGETEDYCIDIQAASPCSGSPNSGTASVSTPTGCISDVFNLNATGLTVASGLTFQWQSAPSASGPWTNMTGGTTPNFTATAANTTFYQLVSTCTISSLSATSSIVSFTPSNCYLMNTGTITACGGTLYDSGGPNNNYQNNENYTLTIVPATPGASVQLTFSSFLVETCCDYLQIYDGATTAAPLIGQYTALPPNIMASNAAGVLTLRFYSDLSVVQTGFAAAITCSSGCSGPPAAPAASGASICAGNTVALTAASTGTAMWYATATPTNAIATGSLFTTPVLNTSITYYVSDSTNCGQSTLTAVDVTVVPGPSVAINASTLTSCEGSSVTLTGSGASTYTWSTSSNNAVIVVNPTVTTSYTLSGSQNGCPDGSAVVSISVNPLPTVSMSIGAGTNTICVMNGSLSLTGSPSGGIFSGPAVSGSLISIANAGTFTPMYSYTNSVTGCVNTATAQLIVANCTGINSLSTTFNGLSVRPNPTSGVFVIETGNTLVKQIEITDLTGRIVYSGNNSSETINVDINNLANGLYNLKVNTENGTSIIKIIKQ